VSDRILPIGPHPATANAIPSIRRSDGSTEKRDRGAPPRKRPPPPGPPPEEPTDDDGRPHIDVRV
jgi:hypothetical protein